MSHGWVFRKRKEAEGKKWLLIAAVGMLFTVLAHQLHELTHHFVGIALCGLGGHVDVSSFELPPVTCEPGARVAAVLAGPMISLLLAVAASVYLRFRSNVLALLCVFSSFFHLRFLLVAGGSGDEAMLLREMDVESVWPWTILLFGLSLPPLIPAFRDIRARGYGAGAFLLCYLMPIPALVAMDSVQRFLFGPSALTPMRWQEFRVLGVSVLGMGFIALVWVAAFILASRLRGRT